MNIEERNDLMFKMLQAIQADIITIKDDIKESNQRLSSVEISVAMLHTDMASMNGRIDRMSNRVERLERRLELSSD